MFKTVCQRAWYDFALPPAATPPFHGLGLAYVIGLSRSQVVICAACVRSMFAMIAALLLRGVEASARTAAKNI